MVVGCVMYFLRQFDPWKGKYCTCESKYSLAPYTGCDHRCIYCYITTYIKQPYVCRPKQDFIRKLTLDLKKADNNIPISISNSSDPYPTIEKRNKLTRETLKTLTNFDFNVLLVTKSDIYLRDLDIIKSNNVAITATINTNDDDLAKILEPGAPSPSKRLSAVEILVSHSVPVMVRVDPIIPGLNNDVDSLLSELSNIGVKYITTSTFKARPDSLKRMIKAFPELSYVLRYNYLEKGKYINHSWYLPTDHRRRLMKKVYETAKKYKLKFNMCREGLKIPKSSPSCDGQHLFNEL